MASIKIGKTEINGITAVDIRSSKDYSKFIVQVLKENGKTLEAKFPTEKMEFTRIEVNGNVKSADFGNCGTVIGDISVAEVGGSIYNDGFVETAIPQYGRPGESSVELDRYVHITDEDERDKGGKRAVVIHINGDIRSLKENAVNVSMLSIIKGNVNRIRCGNVLSCKGRLYRASYVGSCRSTCGLPSRWKERQEQQRRHNQQLEKELNDMFSSLRH